MILFDFDGVFVNTFDSLRELTRLFDGVDVPPEEYRSFFDGHLFEHPRRNEFKSFDDPILKNNFYAGYRDRLSSHSLIDGIDEVTRSLAENYEMHVVTSGDQDSISLYLQNNGLRSHFGSVLGWQTHESKIEKFKMLGVSKEEAKNHLFITDTLGDLEQANSLGLPAIGVSWGFHNEDRLKKGNPYAIANTPQELLLLVRDFYRKTN